MRKIVPAGNWIAMEQTLLLNATYEPLKIVHWQKAVTLWVQGKVEVISVYDREVRAVSFTFRLPSVIRLLRRVKIRRKFDYVPFSRANIYARDHYTCQYCGHAFAHRRSHVRPRRAGRARRPEGLGEHRHLLHHVQSQEGRTHARAGAHAARCVSRGVRTARQRCGSRSGCATRPTPGATISTGTSSSTTSELRRART